MTGWEKAYAVAIVAGIWLRALVLVALAIAAVLLLGVLAIVVLALSMTRGVQRLERGTRPW